MSTFGGSIKLTGEEEYKKALQTITSNLKLMSSTLKSQTSDFNSQDKSIKNTAQAQKQLNDTIKQQQQAINVAKNSLSGYTIEMQKQSTIHNQLNREYKNAVLELERIKKTSGETSEEYKKQAQVVDKLENELIDSQIRLDDNKQAMSSLKKEISSSQKVINDAQNSLDNLGKELDDTEESTKKAGDGFTVFKGVVSDLTSKAIQGAISGVKKLAGALIDLGKQSISNYADYEQLIGGVETLFKESSDIVKGYSEQAYKTAGLSANQYMETVTSFSASLLQGLGGDTKKAAEIADLAIIDMSDNANKMGTSMEMIQNAYQGFAKQNYTMLDNLKLGYGGTKTEMARLVKESGILGEAGKDLTEKNLDQKVSYDQIIMAIHKVQENMGITGTTAKEASSTITGSVSSMKASWQNLLTAIADDNKDLGKSVDEFIDSVITASQNLVPRVKKVVDGIKKLINTIINDVFPKLKKEIPELAPLIETFEWFIKNKSLVTGAIKTMVGAFAITKIVNFTKSLSDGAKSLLDMAKNMAIATTTTNANTTAQIANTTAQASGTIVTKALTGATNLLNVAWKSNPLGVVVAGVTALITAYNALKGKTSELTEEEMKQKAILEEQTKAIDEQSQKINDNKNAWKDLVEAQQNQINTGMTEISHLQSLQDELKGLVDENGRVKKGYEGRASFILSTLNNALGTEYTMTGNIINKYGELTSSIDNVMEKKKAQIILDSQESLYSEAINNQTEATKTLIEIKQQLMDKDKERMSLESQHAELQQQLSNATISGNYQVVNTVMKEIQAVEEKINANNEATATIQKNYNEQEGLLQEYIYNIGQYETNMALAHEGKYNEMTQVTWDYVKDFQEAGEAEKAQIEDQIQITEASLGVLKDLKDKSGTDLYNSQIQAQEKQLQSLKDNLNKYNDTTKTELSNARVIWSNGLDDQLSEITGSKVYFKEDGKGNVQAYIDGIGWGKPKSKQEMSELVKETILEISKQETGAKDAGEDLIEGVNKGIANERKQNGAFSAIANFGNKLLNKLKASLVENSPSKATNEMGQFLLEGLSLGISDEENSVLRQVSNFGKSVISSLNQSLNGNVNMSSISRMADNMPLGYNNQSLASTTKEQFSYNSMVEAFQEALATMKIELDDEEAGRFVRKTVEDTIYT